MTVSLNRWVHGTGYGLALRGHVGNEHELTLDQADALRDVIGMCGTETGRQWVLDRIDDACTEPDGKCLWGGCPNWAIDLGWCGNHYPGDAA